MQVGRKSVSLRNSINIYQTSSQLSEYRERTLITWKDSKKIGKDAILKQPECLGGSLVMDKDH